ncbi:Prolyl oligopeptidase family protein [Bryocella elongata]|uniref:Prolyl oligopeptidase family protein n=1 Tax=Bryocella elongata TaxID=863522 RepID=A0A1H6AHI3_9BACT|nr:alpha/beta fold hydrolase [Bryocella elongata]SEG47216.1 Prolyl oligopeptidase family protein [Bryocella elongata]
MRIVRWLAAVSVMAVGIGCAAQDSQDAWEASMHDVLHTPYDSKLPALDAKVWSTFSPTPGVLADRVTYSTASEMLVPAIVYRPDPKVTKYKGQLPGIVIVNGHGSDKFGWYAFYSGMMFAKAGAVVITYDPIGEGERNARKASMENPSPHDADVTPPAPIPHDDWGQRLAGLMQVDLAQAISYLRAQPEVDPKRIGVAGYSMGAFITGLAAAMDYYDHRIAAVVLSGGGTYDDAAGGYFDVNRNPCQAPPYRALLPWLKIKGEPARGEILYALIASSHHPMLIMNGDNDTVMDIPHHNAAWFQELHDRTMKDFGLPQSAMFQAVFYPGISHRTSWVNRDGVEWLNSQLHFPFWKTNAIIEAQGTTHVSTWITANHVAISKNYFREDREGGLDAVGTGLPGIPRGDLMVLPDADWQRVKDRLTYEAWAAKTMAVEQEAAEKLRVH